MKKFFFSLIISFSLVSSFSQTNLLYKTYSANYPCYGGSNIRPMMDANGNSYFVYCFFDSANFQAPNGNHLIQTGPMWTGDQDILILKLDPNGNIIYKGSIGGVGTNVEAVSAAALNLNNEILVAIQSSEATIDVDPSAGINNVTNPMQFGAMGQVIIRYDANFNVLNTYTQFTGLVANISSSQNNWLITYVVDPGSTADIDLTATTQNISNLSGTNMQTKVIAKYNSAGVYNSHFSFQQGNILTSGIFATITDVHTNSVGEVFIVGDCEDSALVNTIGGPVLSLPGNSNVFFMKLNPSMQCVYYKNIVDSSSNLYFPSIQGDDNGNAYIAFPQNFGLTDLDPGPGIIQGNGVNEQCGIVKYDANGNYLGRIGLNNSFGINNHFSNFVMQNNKLLFTFLAPGFGSPCMSVDHLGSTNLILTPNYDDFPVSLIVDTSLNVISYFSPDTLSGNGNFYQNFGAQFTPSGIMWTMYTVDWFDTDFSSGFDTIPANSLAFISINGGQYAGANTAEGKTYFDLDLNMSYSASDVPVPFRFIKTSSNSYMCLSDSVGDYKLYLPNGTHSYTQIGTIPMYYSQNPLLNFSTFTVIGSIDLNKDFQFSPTPGIHDLQVFQLASTPHRRGMPAAYEIIVSNVGTTTSNYVLKVVVDTAMKSISTIPPFNQQNGDTLIWTGLSISPMLNDYFQINSIIDTASQIGDSLLICSFVQNNPETTPLNNTYCDYVIVSAGYDPNYKEVNWGSDISVADMSTLPWFYYTVHFQNTGTDTAFNIHVIDTVRNYFNLGSFEFLHASHPCQVNYLGNNILDFKFQNILLPDSNTNVPLSQGHFTYRIKPIQNWPAGTVIQNGAAIYFDFNAPVITAPMLTTVVAPVGINSYSQKSSDINVYPNPGNGIFRIQSQQEVERVVVFNLMGQNVASAEITGKEKIFDLDLRHLENGVYIANIFNNGKASVVKIIVQH